MRAALRDPVAPAASCVATDSRNQSTRASAAGRLVATLARVAASSASGSPPWRPVRLGAAVLDPVADHRLGGLGVELRADVAAAADQLRPDVVAGEDVEAGGRREHVVVPLHPRPGGDRRSVDGDGRPTRSPAVGARLTVPPRACASTWAPKQIPSSGTPRSTTSRTNAASAATSGRRLGPVDVPLRAERQHELDAGEVRPVPRLLALALDEREPALPQLVPDEPAVELSGFPTTTARTHRVYRSSIRVFRRGGGPRTKHSGAPNTRMGPAVASGGMARR